MSRKIPQTCDRCEKKLTERYWQIDHETWTNVCIPCHKVWRHNQGEEVAECKLIAPLDAQAQVRSGMPSPRDKYTQLGAEIGVLVESKQKQYGRAAEKTGKILAILYPDGVQPHQYTDMLIIVRILDKCSRIAQRGPDGKDLGGESPYRDLAGYGLIGWEMDEQ